MHALCLSWLLLLVVMPIFGVDAVDVDEQTQHEQQQLVSIIMPVYERPVLLNLALEQIGHTNYKGGLEIIVIDDSEKAMDAILLSSYLSPTQHTLVYRHLDRRVTVGEKRNIACTLSRGEIVIMMDDDDIYHPNRIAYQIKPITNGIADMTVLRQDIWLQLYGDGRQSKFFQAKPKMAQSVHYGTLAFRKDVWNPDLGIMFTDASLLDEVDFYRKVKASPSKQIIEMSNNGMHIYVRHPQNINRPGTDLAHDRRFMATTKPSNVQKHHIIKLEQIVAGMYAMQRGLQSRPKCGACIDVNGPCVTADECWDMYSNSPELVWDTCMNSSGSTSDSPCSDCERSSVEICEDRCVSTNGPCKSFAECYDMYSDFPGIECDRFPSCDCNSVEPPQSENEDTSSPGESDTFDEVALDTLGSIYNCIDDEGMLKDTEGCDCTVLMDGLEPGAKEIARSIWDDTSKDSTHIDFDSSEATCDWGDNPKCIQHPTFRGGSAAAYEACRKSMIAAFEDPRLDAEVERYIQINADANIPMGGCVSLIPASQELYPNDEALENAREVFLEKNPAVDWQPSTTTTTTGCCTAGTSNTEFYQCVAEQEAVTNMEPIEGLGINSEFFFDDDDGSRFEELSPELVACVAEKMWGLGGIMASGNFDGIDAALKEVDRSLDCCVDEVAEDPWCQEMLACDALNVCADGHMPGIKDGCNCNVYISAIEDFTKIVMSGDDLSAELDLDAMNECCTEGVSNEDFEECFESKDSVDEDPDSAETFNNSGNIASFSTLAMLGFGILGSFELL